MEHKAASPVIPSAFIARRLHSLVGVFLVLFLCEHLLTNSMSVLPLGEDGAGFIRGVNFIYSLPYLKAIEVLLLALPFAVHIFWGIRYLRTSSANSCRDCGNTPYLPYERNKAYTFQRLTSYVLIIGVLAHVIHMRFLEYPEHFVAGNQARFAVKVRDVPQLHTFAARTGVLLFTAEQIEKQKEALHGENTAEKDPFARQVLLQKQESVRAMSQKPLRTGELIAVATNPGLAFLMVLHDTFKDPLFCAAYTLLVLCAVFHACNGLWTASLSWGFLMTSHSQAFFLKICKGLSLLLAFLGLAAIWGTYLL